MEIKEIEQKEFDNRRDKDTEKNHSGDLTSKQCEFQKENAKIQKKEKLLKKEYQKKKIPD